MTIYNHHPIIPSSRHPMLRRSKKNRSVRLEHLESVAQWPTSLPPEPSSCPQRMRNGYTDGLGMGKHCGNIIMETDGKLAIYG